MTHDRNRPNSHIPITPFLRPYPVRVGITYGLPVIREESGN